MPKAKNVAKLPGFRDFAPEDFAFRSRIFDAWRRVSRRYGFLEYDGPPLEALELYTQKSGDEIVGQLYDFVDKGERHIALRPEMTPSLARMLGERSRALPKPIRWFSIPQLFRYERQQRGRLREHFQWNVDLVGEAGVEADAEVLATALAGLQELGLGPDDIRARISDRILLSELLRSAGVPEEALLRTFGIVDKIERMRPDAILARLRDPEGAGLSEEAARRVLGLFGVSGLDAVVAAFPESEAVASRAAEVRRYLSVLEELGFADFVEFDLTIVRGLAYYTGIVFEVFDRQGEFRAICGGGRYDHLLELVGGDPLPAVGFGMGDVVLGELLVERGIAPSYARRIDYFIVSVDESLAPVARRIGASLRSRGHSVAYPLRGQPVRKQFSAASTEGAAEVVILGPDEVARGIAMIRDMESGEEREVPLATLEVN
ncbi:MAG: histidine--tRNA ligase [Gemmatimonadota bacterium]